MRENYLGIPVPVCNEKQVRADYEKLTKLLIEKQMTITTMESATSGQIASLITDTEGASAVMKGAFVTYSNQAKIMQGVPAEVIEKYSVYSEETAIAMAKSCAEIYKTNIGVGVTGTMGNIDPKNQDASVPGQVYFAIYIDGEYYSYKRSVPKQPSRLLYKLFVAHMVCVELLKLL